MLAQVASDFPQRVAHRVRHHHQLDRQLVAPGKFPVALVMSRHRHHRAGAVAHQHEIGHEYRQFFAADRVQRAQAGVPTALFLGFQFRLGRSTLAQLRDKRGQFGIPPSGMRSQRMLGGDGQEGHAHQGIRTGRVHGQRFERSAGGIAHGKGDVQAHAAPDPVALHRLDRIRPSRQVIETVQQLLGVVGDLQEPLGYFALLDQRAGAPAAAVDHLLIGQYGLVDGIPVDHRVLAVGETLLHQAHEHALLVDVVRRLTGGKLARPVDRVAHLAQLGLHVTDVGVGPLRRRGVVLDRGVLRRQAERVPAHRLQHVVAGHALVAADDVADRVVAHVTHVQSARRVRQHRQAIELGFVRGFVDLECPVVIPVALSGRFQRMRFETGPARGTGVIAAEVGGGVDRHRHGTGQGGPESLPQRTGPRHAETEMRWRSRARSPIQRPHALRSLTRSTGLVENSYRVISTAEAIRSLNRSAEADARGYRLSGREEQFNEYQMAVPRPSKRPAN